jgi:glycerol kinase
MKAVLALDQGTTSSRAMVFDAGGRILASAQREFPQHFPRNGWVEHEPADLWNSQLAVARAALRKSGLRPEDVAAVGIANQRETALLWDRRTGRPLHRAVVWQDRRTADLCAQLRRRGLEPLFRRRTGLRLDPYFSGTKVKWMLDHLPGARARARRGEIAFGTVDTWLAWNLSGGRLHVTDPSNASRTLLFNIRTGDWDDELLAALDIPRELLPVVRDTSCVVGFTERKLFGRELPIAALVGDQQAALFGQLCLKPGLAKNTYGTGCFLLLNTGAKPVVSRHHLLTTVAWRLAGRTTYALEGSVFIGGAVVQWLRDGLGVIRRSADIERLAASVPNSGGVVFVPAFAGLGAPYWDPHARGALIGLTRATTASHIARAALEAIAQQSADVLEAMGKDAGTPLRELRVDGGASVNNALMQLQSDLSRVPAVRPTITETTARGAAFLAGLAVGFWKSPAQLARLWKPARVFRPRMAPAEAAACRALWARAVQRARRWAEEKP